MQYVRLYVFTGIDEFRYFCHYILGCVYTALTIVFRFYFVICVKCDTTTTTSVNMRLYHKKKLQKQENHDILTFECFINIFKC